MLLKGMEKDIRVIKLQWVLRSSRLSRDEQRVAGNGKCNGNTEIFNPETLNYLTQSLR